MVTVSTTDPRVEEIRARLETGPFAEPTRGEVEFLLAKLDEAEREIEVQRRNALLNYGAYVQAHRRAEAAEERERTLIAGVKEAICALDLVDVHQYELGSGSVGDIARTLSRLLPSQLPTAPGLYEGPRGARWELDAEGQWWFRGYPDREHPTPNQQDRTEFDVLTYGMPLLPSTPTEEGKS